MEIFLAEEVNGDRLVLGEEETAHCVRVLRHREGDPVDVIDGRGTMFHCRLVETGKKAVLEVLERVEGWGSHPYRLTLAVCPTKNNERFEWFIEKAVEIGVDTIVPVIGDRSERKVYKTDRARRIAVSAAKQSLKGAVPEILEPVTVGEFIRTCSSPCRLIAYCFDGDKVSIKQALEGAEGPFAVLIGPEGDFSPEEVESALALGWRPVHLGSSRLRTETAAVTAAEAVYFHHMI